jgi:hypothetical protein
MSLESLADAPPGPVVPKSVRPPSSEVAALCRSMGVFRTAFVRLGITALLGCGNSSSSDGRNPAVAIPTGSSAAPTTAEAANISAARCLRNPDRNIGVFWNLERVERTGDRVQLIGKPPASLHDTVIHGFLVARHGKLVVEEYFHGFHRDRVHDTRSAARSAPISRAATADRWSS